MGEGAHLGSILSKFKARVGLIVLQSCCRRWQHIIAEQTFCSFVTLCIVCRVSLPGAITVLVIIHGHPLVFSFNLVLNSERIELL
jgi:hypothetical protein